jgi:hypothetical protein
MGEQPSLWDRVGESAARHFYPKRWTFAALEKLFADLESEAGTPYPQRRPVPEPSEIVARMVAPIFENVGRTHTRHVAHLRLLRAQLALHEHRARTGRLPASLGELDSKLKTALTDPFAEKPFVYRLKGEGYLLYSLGPDLRDDGGTPVPRASEPPVGDYVAGRLFPTRVQRPPLTAPPGSGPSENVNGP